jgi:ketosteroid isomerase-like protein
MTTRDAIQAYFDRLNEKTDWESFLSEDLEFRSFGTPFKHVTGRPEFRESTKRFYSMIKTATVKEIIVDGARACALVRYELQPPGGPTLESHVAEVFTVRDDRITSFDIYFDSAPFPK